MPRKSFEAGMEAGAKPFEEKFRKQADAIEKVGSRIDSRLDEISNVMDVMIEDLSAQERKRVYDLNTVVDISELDKTEKDYLCAIVYAIAGLNSSLSKEQKEYLRALKSYLMITNVQAEVNLASIENIDNITTQKAIMQTIMEFLFLEYGNHDYMDDYEDVFDYFSVNRKGIREIQEGIDIMYETVGLQGVANHYNFLSGMSEVSDDEQDAKEDTMLTKAEKAYLQYNIKEAFSLFTYLAERGNGRACYFLGEIYMNNFDNVARIDKTEAKKYREFGAEYGDILSRLNCAYSTDNQKEKDAIFADVFPDVLALARQGDVFAMNEVADMFAHGYGTQKNEDNALYWLEESANGGYWRSINKLGEYYFKNSEYPTSIEYFVSSSNIGYEQSISWLAYLYREGIGTSQDVQKAINLYQQAATKGHANSAYQLAVLYHFADFKKYGVKKDPALAKKWYEEAIANPGATGEMWFDYATFIDHAYDYYGIDRDSLVLKALIKASELGYTNATIEAAFRFCTNKGVSQDMKNELGKMEYKDHSTFAGELFEVMTAKDWRTVELKNQYSPILKKYAEEGNAAAQYYYGMLYTSNSYLGKNYDIAKGWVKKSASQGIIAAQNAQNELSKFIKVLLTVSYFVFEETYYGRWVTE